MSSSGWGGDEDHGDWDLDASAFDPEFKDLKVKFDDDPEVKLKKDIDECKAKVAAGSAMEEDCPAIPDPLCVKIAKGDPEKFQKCRDEADQEARENLKLKEKYRYLPTSPDPECLQGKKCDPKKASVCMKKAAIKVAADREKITKYDPECLKNAGEDQDKIIECKKKDEN